MGTIYYWKCNFFMTDPAWSVVLLVFLNLIKARKVIEALVIILGCSEASMATQSLDNIFQNKIYNI